MRRMRFTRTTHIDASLGEVFDFFSAPANLGRITPPSMRFRIRRSPARPLREGDRIDYNIRVFGVPMLWTTRIVLWRPTEVFADLQERGPYRYWLHTHTFRAGNGGVEMIDEVEYELPLGIVGRFFGSRLVARQLERIFDYRAAAIRDLFGPHER